MRSVLVLRRIDEFTRSLAEDGISVVNCPVIRTAPVDDLTDLENLIDSIADIDAIFITSASAASVLARYANKIIDDFHGRLIVLGRSSSDILEGTGLEVEFVERASSARELLDAIGIEHFKGAQVLFVRGDRSLRTIPKRLSGISQVQEAIVYRTMDVKIPGKLRKVILRDLEAEQIAMACFFSPSGVESFDRQIGLKQLANVAIGAIGETTADSLLERGAECHLVASVSNGQRFADEVIEYLEETVGGID